MREFLEVHMFSRRAGQVLSIESLRRAMSGRKSFLAPMVIIAAVVYLAAGISSGRAASSYYSNLHFFDVSATAPLTVSAASFESTAVAPDSIASIFGSQLATQTQLGGDIDPNTPGYQLPTTLSGTSVEINGRRAGLIFVSSGQINCVIPSATEEGLANLVVRAGDGTVSNGTVQIVRVAPAVFTANSDGRGAAAAIVLRIKNDGTQSYEYIFSYSQTLQRYITNSIDMGQEGERLILILFTSGIRRATDPNGDGNLNENIRVLIGGIEVAPIFAGIQPDYVGLDQINVEIPRTLIGRGTVNVAVSATGYTSSNLSDIEISSQNGAAPPQVSGFGGGSALAGQQLVINGTGFSALPTDNLVRIAGLNADVMTASTNQLIVMVPFGVATGTVSVKTLQGEGVSSNILPVRTSISGIVENTSQLPIGGVTIRLSNSNITTTTNSEGSFVLADVPAGSQFVEIDGGTLQTDPPYPKVTLKIVAQSNRDNQFSRSISIQQDTGSGGSVGSGGLQAPPTSDDLQLTYYNSEIKSQIIKTGDFKLEIADNATAVFQTGATKGQIVLTPVENSRTPVDLPFGYFSSSIVQITPFNTKITPGAKLTFPNIDGFPPGSPAVLFRYDSQQGGFVQEPAAAVVSQDGARIETAPDAIKVTSFYFAAVYRQTTTITGRVLDSDGKTPIAGAQARYRGQDSTTDGNGSHVLRYIPVKNGEGVFAEISYARPSGRVSRVTTQTIASIPGGITRIPDVILPPEPAVKPLTILAPSKLEVDEGKVYEFRFVVTGTTANISAIVRVDGAKFASIKNNSANASNSYILKLTPNYFDAGNYNLVITATNNSGTPTRQDIALTVNNVNQPPIANDLNVSLNEDESLTFGLPAEDADGDSLKYTITVPPTRGSLTFQPPLVIYTPEQNYNGSDFFKFKANDGTADSNIGTVNITVRPINDPPVLTVPGPQSVSEGVQLRFTVSATDPDADQTITLTEASLLPRGASFRQISPNTGEFTWTPNFAQAGIYTVSLKATDNGQIPLSDTKTVQITVVNVTGTAAPPQQSSIK